jgi:hypothetical protein
VGASLPPSNLPGAALTDEQRGKHDANSGSVLSTSIADSAILGASWGHPAGQDSATSRIGDLFTAFSHQSYQTRDFASQFGELQALLHRHGEPPPPAEVPPQQVTHQAALLQNLMFGTTGAPLPSPFGGASHSSELMRDLLLRENSLQLASQLGVDASPFPFGGGGISQLLSSIPAGPPVNSSVGDFVAAQLLRSAPPAAPPPMPFGHSFLPQEVLSTLSSSFPVHGQQSQGMTDPPIPLQSFATRETSSLESLFSVANGSLNSSNSATRTTQSTTARARGPVSVYCRSDEEVLSEYQCLLRQQMEFFEATPEDVASSAQGRNKPIQHRQIGIRCVHCAHLPPKGRPRGAVYYPSKLFSLYQSAQNMAVNHFQTRCPNIPDALHDTLNEYKDRKCHIHGGGKQYWAGTARSLGIVEAPNGLEFEG